jgi:hypothetical protein
MILNRIILIYGIAFDGFQWESYFLASIPDFLHQKVFSCPSVHNNTYNSSRQGPPGGITNENNVEIKNFRLIYLCKKIFFENSHVLPQKTANFRSLIPVNQLTWKKTKSSPCQTFTLVHDTKNRLSISLIIPVSLKKATFKNFLF